MPPHFLCCVFTSSSFRISASNLYDFVVRVERKFFGGCCVACFAIVVISSVGGAFPIVVVIVGVVAPIIVVSDFAEAETCAAVAQVAREVVVVEAVVSYEGVVLWIERVVDVDNAIVDAPLESEAEPFVWTVVIPVYLVAVAVGGVVVVGIKHYVGVE